MSVEGTNENTERAHACPVRNEEEQVAQKYISLFAGYGVTILHKPWSTYNNMRGGIISFMSRTFWGLEHIDDTERIAFRGTTIDAREGPADFIDMEKKVMEIIQQNSRRGMEL